MDGGSANDALGVDHEQAAQRDAGFFDEHAVVAGDALVEIGNQGVIDRANAAIFTGGVAPGQVGKVAVDADADDFSVDGFKFFDFV